MKFATMADYPKIVEFPQNIIAGATFEATLTFDDVVGEVATPVDVSTLDFFLYLNDAEGNVVYEDSTDDSITRPDDYSIKFNVSPAVTQQFFDNGYSVLNFKIVQSDGTDSFIVIKSVLPIEK